ncbi:phosphonate metabolism transcriptional regulator PhnF [Microbacterium murale]|uniref:GntR family phosphonate transport system transcriptional regulator n=1 Tax=Microbacterium murale TaxID=1081040 RepID=A0ABU0PCS3_9MICO|nr:phosphonate metabolism transcriptional regulator PhnF [Microbacterium murale]MDQ0644787.1 GntR family phosphonate transport system transcriptional regulator [Microbacterium murale]
MTIPDPATRSSSGYSAWRLITEELRGEISDSRLRPGDRLPTERSIAERYGVNRHTARQAIAALAEDGLIESRRGSGTFITGESVLVHRIGLRTRMVRSLGDEESARSSGRVLDSAIEAAPEEVARRLGLTDGEVVRIESTRSAGDQPISVGTHWFAADRLPDIADSLRRTGSITAALRAHGIDDYLRASTVVGARHATATEAELLAIRPGAIVLVAEALDTLPDGTPLQYLVTRFAAQRVRLDIEPPHAD